MPNSLSWIGASFTHILPKERLKEWFERNVSLRVRQRRIDGQNKVAKSSDEGTEQYLKRSFCKRPFTDIETTPSGLVYVCCPAWLPKPIGTIDKELNELWSGPVARDLRASIVDGSFKYCSRLSCAAITGRTLPSIDSVEAKTLIEEFKGKPTPPPRHIGLSHDRSCNLSCPSCRSENILAGKEKQKRLDELVEDRLLPMLKNAESVYITGSGDPFGSAHFRRLIKRLTREEYPNLKFVLQTNGQLWDRKAWEALDLKGRVTSAHISIDAAEAEAYSILRRGGTLERLLKNMAYVKELRELNEFEHLTISMVVQDLNFRQMPEFVKLGKRFAADLITFQMIRNWGTYSTAEFDKAYVGRVSHPGYTELLKVLEDPILAESGVDIGNVRTHVAAAFA
jgi:organic radical activating enzyme